MKRTCVGRPNFQVSPVSKIPTDVEAQGQTEAPARKIEWTSAPERTVAPASKVWQRPARKVWQARAAK